MFLELERGEEFLLCELVRARIRELGQERDASRKCEACGYEREEQLEMLQRLLHRLHETEWDVTC